MLARFHRFYLPGGSVDVAVIEHHGAQPYEYERPNQNLDARGSGAMENFGADRIVEWARENLEILPRDEAESCLLYTSPSPRDRG